MNLSQEAGDSTSELLFVNFNQDATWATQTHAQTQHKLLHSNEAMASLDLGLTHFDDSLLSAYGDSYI